MLTTHLLAGRLAVFQIDCEVTGGELQKYVLTKIPACHPAYSHSRLSFLASSAIKYDRVGEKVLLPLQESDNNQQKRVLYFCMDRGKSEEFLHQGFLKTQSSDRFHLVLSSVDLTSSPVKNKTGKKKPQIRK